MLSQEKEMMTILITRITPLNSKERSDIGLAKLYGNKLTQAARKIL